MAKVEEARAILKALGLPKPQTNERSGYTLLALCGLGPNDPWSAASREAKTITKGMMDFMAERFGKIYKPNSREVIRRFSVHQFIQAGVAERNPFGLKATNSQDFHYAVSEAALKAIRAFGTPAWSAEAKQFLAEHAALSDVPFKQLGTVPVTLPDGSRIALSYGEHNELQRDIIEDFGRRFASGAILLYVGDTAKKDVFLAAGMLAQLGIEFTGHDKLPDVILYDSARDWLFLIEAVTSHGPMSQKRLTELKPMLQSCKVGRIYVSAFPDLKTFRKYASNIAWETEVWLADPPDHLIHFNGDRFFGPRDGADWTSQG